MRGFVLRMIWEAAQNVPLIAGVLAGAGLGRQGQWAAAAVTLAAAAVLAAAVIWITEPLIFAGHKETGRAVLGNVLTFSALMLVATLYLSATWSSWGTDLIAGLLLALTLAAGQELAARERFGLMRSLALGLSCAGSLLLIRALLDWPLIVSLVTVTAWFTLVMGLYKEARIVTGWIPATAQQETQDQEPVRDGR